jgi:hypothetical protein
MCRRQIKIRLKICLKRPPNTNLQQRQISKVYVETVETVGYQYHTFLGCNFLSGLFTKRKVERQVKVLFENLAIFFLCPSVQFLPISFQIKLLEYFPQKQKEQRHNLLGYTDLKRYCDEKFNG